jgi:hypothetical protein
MKNETNNFQDDVFEALIPALKHIADRAEERTIGNRRYRIASDKPYSKYDENDVVIGDHKQDAIKRINYIFNELIDGTTLTPSSYDPQSMYTLCKHVLNTLEDLHAISSRNDYVGVVSSIARQETWENHAKTDETYAPMKGALLEAMKSLEENFEIDTSVANYNVPPGDSIYLSVQAESNPSEKPQRKLFERAREFLTPQGTAFFNPVQQETLKEYEERFEEEFNGIRVHRSEEKLDIYLPCLIECWQFEETEPGVPTPKSFRQYSVGLRVQVEANLDAESVTITRTAPKEIRNREFTGNHPIDKEKHLKPVAGIEIEYDTRMVTSSEGLPSILAHIADQFKKMEMFYEDNGCAPFKSATSETGKLKGGILLEMKSEAAAKGLMEDPNYQAFLKGSITPDIDPELRENLVLK